MSDPKNVENDLREYLLKEPNLRGEDKLTYLKAIFDKHFAISQLEHSVNYYDVQEIMNFAKGQWVRQSLPLEISRKEISPSDVSSVAMLEAVLNYLTGHKLLRKAIKVEYTRK